MNVGRAVTVLLIDECERKLHEMLELMQWEEHGFSVIGYTCSGVQGVKLAAEHDPDIVLTALRLQDISGIEVLRRVRSVCRRCRVILLDDFAEFTHVRQAMRYGAADYLLRPLERGELLLSLHRGGAGGHPTAETEGENLLPSVLCSGKEGVADGVRKMVLCAGVSLDPEEGLVCPMVRRGEWWYGVAAVAQEKEEDWLRRLEEQHTAIGVSRPFYTADEWAGAIRQAHIAASPFWGGEARVVQESGAMNREACHLLSQLWGLLHQCGMKQYSWHQFWALYDILLTTLQSLQVDFFQITVVFNSLVAMARSIQEPYREQLPYLSLDELDEWAQRGETLSSALVRVRRDLQESLKAGKYDPSSHPSGELANEVLIYLDAHFCEPDISVENVAAKFFISPAYFGQTFKRAYGISITEHINRKRADYAEYLLTHEDLSIKEVAQRVGIQDNYYFSKLFKKYKGMTPGEAKARSTASRANKNERGL